MDSKNFTWVLGKAAGKSEGGGESWALGLATDSVAIIHFLREPNTSEQLWAFVCVCVPVYTLWCMHVWACMWKPEVSFSHCSPWVFFLETGSLSVLPSQQWTLEICLSPRPQHWYCSFLPPCPAFFYRVLRIPLRFSGLQSKHLHKPLPRLCFGYLLYKNNCNNHHRVLIVFVDLGPCTLSVMR